MDSFLGLFLHAGLIQQLIIVLLLGGSIASWACFFYYRKMIRSYQSDYKHFHRYFWSGADLSSIHVMAQSQRGAYHIAQKAFCDCFQSLEDASSFGALKHYALQDAESKHAALVYPLQFLANTASNAPYIGLLGTVIGIMHTLSSMASTTFQNIQAIAPGIGEALVTTALGLFVAIPAAIFYNILGQWIDGYCASNVSFIESMQAIAERRPQS